MLSKYNQLFLLIISMFGLLRVKCSNNRGWAWTCDELENIHTEIQDKYGLLTKMKSFLNKYAL